MTVQSFCLSVLGVLVCVHQALVKPVPVALEVMWSAFFPLCIKPEAYQHNVASSYVLICPHFQDKESRAAEG